MKPQFHDLKERRKPYILAILWEDMTKAERIEYLQALDRTDANHERRWRRHNVRMSPGLIALEHFFVANIDHQKKRIPSGHNDYDNIQHLLRNSQQPQGPNEIERDIELTLDEIYGNRAARIGG